jgi:hypothetical protein
VNVAILRRNLESFSQIGNRGLEVAGLTIGPCASVQSF